MYGRARLGLIVPAAIVLVAPLWAADVKVDLSKETVGKAPVDVRVDRRHMGRGAGRADKVIMVDGRPWVASKDNPTKLLIESARKLYGTSNEELMDNAKQFAYYPVALLKSVDSFSNGTHQPQVQDRRRRRRSLLGHPLQREAERRLAHASLQRHRAQRRALGVPQRHQASADAAARRQPPERAR